MDLLVDTCCMIWVGTNPSLLSTGARDALAHADCYAVVSPASCAELACLSARRRISLDRHWKAWFSEMIARSGWAVDVIDLSIVQEAWSLPGEFHNDPVDRILVATARLRGYTILTADRRILEYPHVKSLW